MQIDICTTATIRPEILSRTFRSFVKNMLQPVLDSCRCIINVDPVGDPRFTAYDVQRVALHYFPTALVCTTPSVPSFPKAFKCVWRSASAPFILHLEEDWELLQRVDILEMMEILTDERELALLRLPFKASGVDSTKQWSSFYQWNGKYFQCPYTLRGGQGFAGHPSLIKREFVHACCQLLRDTDNPEKQFHQKVGDLMDVILKYEYGVYGKPNMPPYVVDTGREWMAKNGWAKKGNKAFFVEWEKVMS